MQRNTSSKVQRALALLSEGESYSTVAKRMGVSTSTLHNWRAAHRKTTGANTQAVRRRVARPKTIQSALKIDTQTRGFQRIGEVFIRIGN